MRVADLTRLNTATRNALLTEFRGSAPRHDGLVLSVEDSSAGMNLVRANHCLFVTAFVPTNNSDAEALERHRRQAVARVWRMGQTRHCKVHYFVANDTVEAELMPKNASYFKDATQEPDNVLSSEVSLDRGGKQEMRDSDAKREEEE